MITGLHHAQITIPTGEEAKAKSFYLDLLGFEEIPKPDTLKGRGGFWMKVGEDDVHVGTEEGFDRRQTKAHLAYQVTDLESWREVLKREGIQTEDGALIPGYIRFEFRDPFGNRVEFIQAIP